MGADFARLPARGALGALVWATSSRVTSAPLSAPIGQRESQQPGGHHSSEATLLRFTESNLALSLGPVGAVAPSDVFAITARIAKLIRYKFGGHRAQATHDCIAALRAKVALPSALTSDEQQVAEELALLCAALDVTDDERLNLLRQMVAAKPCNLHRYQALLTSFLDRSQAT